MAKYHPIGHGKINPNKIIKLSNKEVELIKMIRRVEGDEYSRLMIRMWNHYLNEMEKFYLDTSFVTSGGRKKLESFDE